MTTKNWLRIAFVTTALGLCAAGASMFFAPGEVAASPCCSGCEASVDRCYFGCHGNPACEAQCDANIQPCWHTCNWNC
jgi:hypothetical protein